MSVCNFECLLQLVNKQLEPDKQIEVYDHIERCNICRDAVRQISRDLKGAHCVKAYAIQGGSMRQDSVGAQRARQ
jgi:predicted anti-sigma-YlaC factor YlaD